MTDKASGAPLVALVVGPQGAYAVGPGIDEPWPLVEVGQRFASASARLAPRWVVWSAASTLRGVVGAGVDVARTWDLAETHRIIHGGWAATPGARPRRLPRARPRPTSRATSAAAAAASTETSSTSPRGATRPCSRRTATCGPMRSPGPPTPAQLRELAVLALECQASQLEALGRLGGEHVARLERTVWSESAAAVLCLELERDGLPVDRLAAEDLIAASAGPRPETRRDAARIRAERDRAVLRHAPGRERLDLRNPAQVRELLASVGVDVPNTRAWVLEPYRAHPPARRRPAALAQGRAHRHDLRLPVARRARGRRRPAPWRRGRRATARRGG